MLRRNSIQELFTGYEYDIEQLRHAMIQEKRKNRLAQQNERQQSTQIHHGRSASTLSNLPPAQANPSMHGHSKSI